MRLGAGLCVSLHGPGIHWQLAVEATLGISGSSSPSDWRDSLRLPQGRRVIGRQGRVGSVGLQE
eukprot:2774223-Alexandrium_andersonii.AAC.1